MPSRFAARPAPPATVGQALDAVAAAYGRPLPAPVARALARVLLAPPPDGPPPSAGRRPTVFPGYLVCLECGRRAQSLTRHVRLSHGASFEAYAARWGLGPLYPRVCAAYSARRSEAARAAARRRAPPQ